MTEDSAKEGRSNAVVEILRWILRILIAAAALWLLLCPDKGVVERFASWTSIIFTVGTFYIVTLEPELLGLIIERARRVFERRKKVRSEQRSKRSWSFGRAHQNQQKSGSQTEVKESDFDTVEVNKIRNVVEEENSATDIATESYQPMPPMERLGLLICGVALLYILAVIASGALGRFGAPGATTAIRKDSAAGDHGEPSLESTAEPVESPQPFPAPAVIASVQVKAGDSCYSIALACTGDGERFIELGAPTNAWLDVSDRDYCLIRPNDKVALPENWPTVCANTTQ